MLTCSMRYYQKNEHSFVFDIKWKGMIVGNKTLHKPGEDNRSSGRYIEVGPRGGSISNPRYATIQQGDRLPPTQKAGRRWKKTC